MSDLELRLETGRPFRLGELAYLLGYSRDHLRKLTNAGVLKTLNQYRPGVHRRVHADEAKRFARACGLLG
jgi:excisionase family DNA binding protein